MSLISGISRAGLGGTSLTLGGVSQPVGNRLRPTCGAAPIPWGRRGFPASFLAAFCQPRGISAVSWSIRVSGCGCHRAEGSAVTAPRGGLAPKCSCMAENIWEGTDGQTASTLDMSWGEERSTLVADGWPRPTPEEGANPQRPAQHSSSCFLPAGAPDEPLQTT